MNDIIPQELLGMPLKDIQLNGLTLIVGLTILGRAWKAWRRGGGLMGMWRSFLYGSANADETKD